MVNCGQCLHLMVRSGSTPVEPTADYRIAGAAIRGPNGVPLCIADAYSLEQEAQRERGDLPERVVTVLWRPRECDAFRPIELET